MTIFTKYRSQLIVGSIFLLPITFYILLSLGKHQFTQLDYYNEKGHIVPKNQAFALQNQVFKNTQNDSVFVHNQKGKISLFHLINTNDYLITPAVVANLHYLQDRFADRNDITFISIVQNESKLSDIQQFSTLLHLNTSNWQIWHVDSLTNNHYAQNQLHLRYKSLPDSLQTVIPSSQVVLVDQNLYIRGYFDAAIHKETKGELLDAMDMLIREPYVTYKNKDKR